MDVSDSTPAYPPPLRWLVPLLTAVLLLGLLTALYSASLRLKADGAYKQVMLLVDWHDLNGLTEISDAAKITDLKTRTLPWELMELLPGAYLSYGEESVGNLLEEGILAPAPVVAAAPTYEVVIDQYADDVAKGALRHGYTIQRDANTGGKLYVQFPAVGEAELPVCWRSDVIGLIQNHGIPLILRPTGTEFMGPAGAYETLEFCAGQPLVLFQGKQVLGYPRSIRRIARKIVRQNQLYGWVEFDDQDGGAALANAVGRDHLVRVHSIGADEMVKYTPESAADRYLRAVKERSIRCLYLRPFTRGDVVTAGAALPPAGDGLDPTRTEQAELQYPGYAGSLQDVNNRYFALVRRQLEDAEYAISDRADMPQAGPGPWVRIPIALAAGSGLLWLLLLWFPQIPAGWWKWIVPLELIGAAAMAAISFSSLYALINLKLAIVLPLLGLWLGWQQYQRGTHDLRACHPKRLGRALLGLLIASAFSAYGGLLIHAGMWDAGAILKLHSFKGVTLSLAMPVLLLAAYAWQGESLQAAMQNGAQGRGPSRLTDYWTRLVGLWTNPIRYGDLAFILLAGAVLALVVLRSGNDSGVGAGSLESHLRGSLEQIFSVRPRTKELFGHPMLVLFLLSLPWRSRISGLLAIAGLLGQVSILNTFCHLHTPLAVTLHRESLGLAIGIVSSLLLGIAVLVVVHIWRRRRPWTGSEGALSNPQAAP